MPSSARPPGRDNRLGSADLESLIEQVQIIRSDMLRIVDDSADLLKDIHPERLASAVNLLHYLALRSRDMRPLQWRLADAGLSSLDAPNHTR